MIFTLRENEAFVAESNSLRNDTGFYFGFNASNEGVTMKIFGYIFFFFFITNLQAKEVSKFDFTFNFGPSLTQNGPIEDIGEPDLNTGLAFNYFFKPQHGVGFGFLHEFSFEGSREFPDIDNASISTFDVHYSFRHIMGNFHILFEPGIGWQTFYDTNNDVYWEYYYDDLSSSMIYNYKLLFRYIISEFDSGIEGSAGSFFAGAGIVQTFSVNDEYKNKDISGNRLSALFQLGVGW